MTLRCPIPAEMREQLSKDPWMKRCILSPLFCEGRVQWHHGMTYKGSRVNELFSIIPMCELHHQQEAKYRDAIRAAIRARVEHFGAEDAFRAQYPKSDLFPRKKK